MSDYLKCERCDNPVNGVYSQKYCSLRCQEGISGSLKITYQHFCQQDSNSCHWHETIKSLESQLRAADELAKATSELIVSMKLDQMTPYEMDRVTNAKEAYEKARGWK